MAARPDRLIQVGEASLEEGDLAAGGLETAALLGDDLGLLRLGPRMMRGIRFVFRLLFKQIRAWREKAAAPFLRRGRQLLRSDGLDAGAVTRI